MRYKKYLLASLLLIFFPPHVIASTSFSHDFTPLTSSSISLETSGPQETISSLNNKWTFTAGGYSADTHYSRLKYKIPEKEGIAPTTFYLAATVTLPSDFYTLQKAGFRVLNTDNFSTSIGSSHFGANSTDEFRTAIYFNSDHTIRINSSHDNHPAKEFYRHPTQLSVGTHKLELAGDVAKIAPWYFKIDGVTVANGNERLSPDTVANSDLQITRMVAGIDGAASQSSNPLTLTISSVTFATHAPGDNALPTSPAYKSGDFDHDSFVTLLDYNLIASNFGNPYTLLDYNLIASNFGK